MTPRRRSRPESAISWQPRHDAGGADADRHRACPRPVSTRPERHPSGAVGGPARAGADHPRCDDRGSGHPQRDPERGRGGVDLLLDVLPAPPRAPRGDRLHQRLLRAPRCRRNRRSPRAHPRMRIGRDHRRRRLHLVEHRRMPRRMWRRPDHASGSPLPGEPHSRSGGLDPRSPEKAPAPHEEQTSRAGGVAGGSAAAGPGSEDASPSSNADSDRRPGRAAARGPATTGPAPTTPSPTGSPAPSTAAKKRRGKAAQ